MRKLIPVLILLLVGVLGVVGCGQTPELKNEEPVDPKVAELIKQLGNDDYPSREQARKVLVNMGKPAVRPLIEALKDKDLCVRARVIWALEEIGDKRAVEPLVKMLRDKDVSFRRQSAMSLGKIGDKRAVEPLIDVLKNDKSVEVRGLAVVALGCIKDERAVPALIDALKDKAVIARKKKDRASVEVRQVAAMYLSKITEQGFGENYDKWREWWEENKVE